MKVAVDIIKGNSILQSWYNSLDLEVTLIIYTCCKTYGSHALSETNQNQNVRRLEKTKWQQMRPHLRTHGTLDKYYNLQSLLSQKLTVNIDIVYNI